MPSNRSRGGESPTVEYLARKSSSQGLLTRRVFNQFKRPIESLKGITTFTTPTEREFDFSESGHIPLGLLYRCSITLGEAKCFSAIGGYAVISISDSHGVAPFLTAKTKKCKTDKFIIDSTVDATLFDDRCYVISIVCKNALDVVFAAASIEICDPNEFIDISDWVPLFDNKVANEPKCIIHLKVLINIIGADQERVEQILPETFNVTEDHKSDISSSAYLSKACTNTLKFNKNYFSELGMEGAAGKDRKAGIAPLAVKKARAAKIQKNKISPDDLKMIRKESIRNQANSSAVEFVVSHPDIFIPFEPAPSFTREIYEGLQLRDGMIELGEDDNAMEDVIVLENPTNSAVHFRVPVLPNGISITIPCDEEDSFLVKWPELRARASKRLSKSSKEKLPSLADIHFQGDIQAIDMLQAPSALLYSIGHSELETLEEKKARKYEEQILIQRVDSEIEDMHDLLASTCTKLGVGERNKNQDLLKSTTTREEWKGMRMAFHSKIKRSELTMASDVNDLRKLENPVQETVNYCRQKFSKFERFLDETEHSPLVNRRRGGNRFATRNDLGELKKARIVKGENKEKQLENDEVRKAEALENEEVQKEKTVKKPAENPTKPKLQLRKRKRHFKTNQMDPTLAKELPQMSPAHYAVICVLLSLVIYYWFF